MAKIQNGAHLLLILTLASLANAGDLVGIWQTVTESEFDIRLTFSAGDSGFIEWRAKDMDRGSATCSTWSYHWGFVGDTLRITTPAETCIYNVCIEKLYSGQATMAIKPYAPPARRQFLRYTFYKIGQIRSFFEKWGYYECCPKKETGITNR